MGALPHIFATLGINTPGRYLDDNFDVVGPHVDTIAALRALTSAVAPRIYVRGYRTVNDGGQGFFEYIPTDTTTADNGGTVIVDASGDRWFRDTSCGYTLVGWFGADPTGVLDSYAAFAGALQYGSHVIIAPGTYSLSAPPSVGNNQQLRSMLGAGSVTLQKLASVATLDHLLETAPATLVGSSGVQNQKITISGISLIVDNTLSYGLKIQGCTKSIFEDIYVTGAATVANFWITGTLLQTSPSVISAFANRNSFRDCVATTAVIGFLQQQAAGDTSRSIGNENLYEHCHSVTHSAYGFKNHSGQGVVYIGCTAITAVVGTTCFRIEDSTNTLIGCVTDSNSWNPAGHQAQAPNIFGWMLGGWNNPTPRQATTHYNVNDVICDGGTSGYAYRFVCTTAGTTAAGGPSSTPPVGPGYALNPFASAITDGTAVWQYSAPDPTTYVTGYSFGNNLITNVGSTGSCIYGITGQGCYQWVTADDIATGRSITVAGRNSFNTIPVPFLYGATTFYNTENASGWEFSTITPGQSGLTYDADTSGFNASGTLIHKWTFQNGLWEGARLQGSVSGGTTGTSFSIGRTSTLDSLRGASLTGAGLISASNNAAIAFDYVRLDTPSPFASATYTVGVYKAVTELDGLSICGSVTVNTASHGTAAFNTSSDYRFKEIDGPIDRDAALGEILSVPVYLGSWEGQDYKQAFVLAHELAVVWPHLVNGEKDAMTEDGKIDPQQIDLTRTPHPQVMAAIQALAARVQALEAAQPG